MQLTSVTVAASDSVSDRSSRLSASSLPAATGSKKPWLTRRITEKRARRGTPDLPTDFSPIAMITNSSFYLNPRLKEDSKKLSRMRNRESGSSICSSRITKILLISCEISKRKLQVEIDHRAQGKLGCRVQESGTS
jgi:hypothetical protein